LAPSTPKYWVAIGIVLACDGELPKVVATLCPASRFSGRLDRRQQQGDQDPDDCDDHQQFHKRKTV